jgi:hypothetical protein
MGITVKMRNAGSQPGERPVGVADSELNRVWLNRV